MLTPEQLRAGMAKVSELTASTRKTIKADPRAWVEAIGQAVLDAEQPEPLRPLRKPGAAQLRGLRTIRAAASALADEVGSEDGRAREGADIRAGLGWLSRAMGWGNL